MVVAGIISLFQEASKCYDDALEHEKPHVPSRSSFCSKISRMRVISSPQARAAAEEVLSRIIMPILPPIVFGTAHVSSMLQDGSVDVFGTSADVVDRIRHALRLVM